MVIIPPMTRPTIADVAKKCGVSKTTVSVILNNSLASSSARVSPETQDKVRKAAEELGYRPSWRGRVLSNRKTHIIGVLYAPPMPVVVRGNYEGIMAGINETFQANKYHMMLVPLGDNTAEWGAMILDQRMDGCLVLSRLRDPLPALLKQAQMPVTLVNADTELSIPRVLADEYDGAVENTKHLLSLGHKKIMFALGKQPGHYSVTQRLAGYTDTMGKAGLGASVSVFEGTTEEFVEMMKTSSDRPTAVLAYTHFMAMRLLRQLWEAGIKVPEELSVSTFSNASPVEDFVPPLTTVALPTELMGKTAAEMLLEQIKTNGGAPVKRAVLKTKLIVRCSTASPRS
jgi:DNA-binding LacI/PurR family transcriptional regulator